MRATKVIFFDEMGGFGHLFQVQFAGEHHDVSPLAVVAYCLAVAHVDLGGNMHLHTDTAGKQDGRHIAGDNGTHLGIASGSDDLAHVVHILVIDNGIDREVTLHAMLAAPCSDGAQVLKREIDAGT